MLVLASASAARQALLRGAGIAFVAHPTGARELRGRGRTLRETVLANARLKAAAAARRLKAPGTRILAADTMVAFDGRLYGKPATRADAARWLSRMAGRTHVIATGLVLREGARATERYVASKVTLRSLDAAAVRRIVATYDPTSFAGGYAVMRNDPGAVPENLDDPLIERIEGSLTNVLGLPMETVLPLLGPAAGRRRAVR
jgi:nucleoside triphosphate pyrophosphatase